MRASVVGAFARRAGLWRGVGADGGLGVSGVLACFGGDVEEGVVGVVCAVGLEHALLDGLDDLETVVLWGEEECGEPAAREFGGGGPE